MEKEITSCSYVTSSVELRFSAARGKVAEPCEQKLLSFREKIAVFQSFFNKGLLLNVSGHLKGDAGHFLPVGLEEGSTQPKCLMCDVL